MSKTTNVRLIKPASSDYVSIDVINENMDIIDKELGDLKKVTRTYTGTGQTIELDIGDSSAVLITCKATGYSALVALGAVYWNMAGGKMGQLNWLDISVYDRKLHIDTSNEIVNKDGVLYTYQIL